MSFSTTRRWPRPCVRTLAAGAVLLRDRAFSCDDILAALARVVAQAPFRRMVTPGGFAMSVAMTNCGAAGWVSAPAKQQQASVTVIQFRS